jgi:hypothetical protein
MVRFAVPSIATLARERCGNVTRRAGVIGAAWKTDLVGEKNASLEAIWRTSVGGVKTVTSRADQLGGFAFCDLPPDQPITLRWVEHRRVLAETTIKLGWAEFQWVNLRSTVP